MPDKAWKQSERVIGKRMGGRRGRCSVSGGADIEGVPMFSIECKLTSRPPKYLLDAILEAERHAENNQIPIAVIHPKGARHDKDIVCVRLKDWIDLHGQKELIEQGEFSEKEPQIG